MRRLLILLALMVVCCGVSSADAALIDYQVTGSPDYDWWRGCSPTSAGMMMGYYDRNGYGGLTYGNLVPGGVAELETFSFPTSGGFLANDVIASAEHIADFYSGANDASGDDVSTPFHDFNSLADFMGTSQDSVGNKNGWTKFYYNQAGDPLHDYQLISSDLDGMYGIGEYVVYAGYDYSNLFTQLTDNDGMEIGSAGGFSGGFSFTDYMNEIDNNRVVMLHVKGHSMYGYGYNNDNSAETVYLHDTWSLGQKSMTWGGEYSDRYMWGVTVLEITGGDVIPEPASLAVWSVLCMLGIGYGRRRKRKAA